MGEVPLSQRRSSAARSIQGRVLQVIVYLAVPRGRKYSQICLPGGTLAHGEGPFEASDTAVEFIEFLEPQSVSLPLPAGIV